MAKMLPVAHIYDQDASTFKLNGPTYIQSVVARRIIPTTTTDVPEHDEYQVTFQHGPFERTICKLYGDFNDLNNALTRYLSSTSSEAQNNDNEWPCLPVSVNDNIDDEYCEILCDYLNKVVKHSKCQYHPVMYEFFEVSYLSLAQGTAVSLKEGYLLIRSSDEYQNDNFFRRLPLIRNAYQSHNQQRWFAIKDSFVTYIRPDTSEVRFPMLVDRAFEVVGNYRNSNREYDIELINLQRQLRLKCKTLHDYEEWMRSFNVLKDKAHCFMDSSANRFHSFAPIRPKQLAYWFINGKSYMESIAKAIQSAKEEIFITDWWLSPELMLIRPSADDSMRLDNLLGKVADEGVRVYIMIFREVSFVSNINSSHTQQILISKSKKGNIKVIRHPNHDRISSELLWAHNEKTLIIDQKIAFIGGIDLCFGRWDDEFYRIVDLDKTNDRILKIQSEIVQQRNEAYDEMTIETNINRTRAKDIDTKNQYFIGKDYINIYEKQIEAVERYNEDFIDRKLIPRTPWHDEALVVFGEVARDAARHFIQCWNIHKCEKFLNNTSYPFLLPKTHDDQEELTVNNWREFLDGQPYQIDAQCVRSIGPWSAGTKTTETSIQHAYIQMIDAAKYFIYIETQFFVTVANDPTIQNQLAEALYQRVLRAHTSREKFRIYILLPLLPGFNNTNSVQAALHFIMRSIAKDDSSLFKRLEANSIPPNDYISFFGLRQHDILMGHLVTEMIYVHSKLMIIDDCMAICGSANLNDRSLLGARDSEFCVVVTDIEEEDCLFDGRSVRVGKFCSSWRRRIFSMMLGIMPDDKNKTDVSDPVSDQFYNYFRQVAHKNTLIYEKVFGTMPTDRVRRFEHVVDIAKEPKLKDIDPHKAQEELKGIQGLVVEYPIYFLDEENYLPSFRTREGLAPVIIWT